MSSNKVIRKAGHSLGEATEIIDLISQTFPECFLVKRGPFFLMRDILSGLYISYAAFERSHVVGHAGVQLLRGIGIFGSLVVDKRHRSCGIGRTLFKSRLDDALNNESIQRIVSYVSLRQPITQSLYDFRFKPVGLSISQNPYSREESEYSQGSLSLELVLGYNKFERFSIKAPKSLYFEEISKLYKVLGGHVTPGIFSTSSSSLESQDILLLNLEGAPIIDMNYLSERDFRLLGILPSGATGLNILGFASQMKLSEASNTCIYYVQGKEREDFVNSVLNS